MFYDVGRLIVVGEGVDAVGQIHDFPATPDLCARFQGIWEGIASGGGRLAVAAETRCRLRGDAWCEFRVSHEG